MSKSIVLHVDDNAISRYTRTSHLRRAGFQVVEAATGRDAIALASSECPAIIVLDIRLPDINGFEVCRRLKEDSATASIPVLHISALGRAEHDYPEALESGADAYLREPVEAELLIAAVNSLLRASAAEAERDEFARREKHAAERLELAQRAGKIGVFEWDFCTNTVAANSEVEAMMGVAPGTFNGTFETWAAFVLPEDHARVERSFQQAIEKQQAEIEYDFRIRRMDGAIRWLTARAKIFHDESGVPQRAIGINVDVTERVNWEQALRESEERYRLLVEANPIGVVWGVIGGAEYGKLRIANQAFLNITGYVREDIETGAVRWTDLTPSEFLHVDESAIRQALATTGRSQPYEKEYIRKDGTRVPVLVAFAVVGEQRHEAVAFVVDISGHKRVEEELRQRTEELARSNEDLQRFAYAASHDLQEPLRTISAYSQLLERRMAHCLDEDTRQYLRFIKGGTDRMSALVRDLLEYSRIGHPGEEVRARADCNVILDWALQHLRKIIDETGAEVTADPLPTVAADQSRLVQVFQNLVGNAIKYRRPQVRPCVHNSARRTSECWEFSVADNGIGFDMRHAEQIFEPFQRLHGKGSEYEGTGIGLAICRRIIERHGGKMWAISEPGKGSTFFFTLAATVDVQVNGACTG